MADTAVAVEAPAPATPAKKPKASAAKKPKPTHPRTSEMVTAAITELKERSGSSLKAIKKYIAAEYKVDTDKLAPFIRRYLRSAVESGELIQTKGTGASGSFKLESKTGAKKKPAGSAVSKKESAVTSSPSKAKKPAAKPAASAGGKRNKAATASPSKSSKAAAKPAIKDKKAAAAKRKPAAARKAAASPAKARSAPAPKAKKTAKPPTKKPKAPKPKKAAATPKSKAAAGKKATASKK